MRSIQSLIEKLAQDYPEFRFESAEEFLWSARKKTVFYNQKLPHSQEYILHELSHAILGHSEYKRDIELIKLERDAWEYAKMELAPRYGMKISEDTVQDNLDTYRDWLYARSTCPECHTTGIETKTHDYRCFACGHIWRVNEARICALRRYSLQQTK